MAIDFENPTSLYRQIVADITRKITSGDWQQGEKIASQRELAQSYGVSLITVKRAISELVNAELLYSRVGIGLYVSAPTTTVTTAARKTIGGVLRDITDPFYSPIFHGVEEAVHSTDYHLLLANSAKIPENEDNQILYFREMGVCGLLIASDAHTRRASPVLRQLHESGFPYIMVSYVADPDMYHIGVDHERGAYLATEHLIQLGYRKIGYLNTHAEDTLGQVRLHGYRNALNNHGIPYDPAFTFHPQDSAKSEGVLQGKELGAHIAQLKNRPAAFVSYGDNVALGFQMAILDAGLKIPEDMALVGFDDIEWARHAAVPLTTIQQPTDDIGRLAVELLMKRMEGVDVNLRTTLQPTLIIRDSCGAKLRSHDVAI